jgi:hypothetical protein
MSDSLKPHSLTLVATRLADRQAGHSLALAATKGHSRALAATEMVQSRGSERRCSGTRHDAGHSLTLVATRHRSHEREALNAELAIPWRPQLSGESQKL